MKTIRAKNLNSRRPYRIGYFNVCKITKRESNENEIVKKKKNRKLQLNENNNKIEDKQNIRTKESIRQQKNL